MMSHGVNTHHNATRHEINVNFGILIFGIINFGILNFGEITDTKIPFRSKLPYDALPQQLSSSGVVHRSHLSGV